MVKVFRSLELNITSGTTGIRHHTAGSIGERVTCMCCILSVKSIRLKDDAGTDEVLVGKNRLAQQLIQFGTAACRPRLLDQLVYPYKQILSRLLDTLVAAKNQLGAPLQFVVLCP